MNYYKKVESKSQNLIAGNYLTQDGHGGRAEEHRKEMEQIAIAIFRTEYDKIMKDIEEKIFAAQYRAYEQALKDVLGVLEYDIESVTRIGIEGCKDIFEGRKAQKYISDKIVELITKELKNKHFRP